MQYIYSWDIENTEDFLYHDSVEPYHKHYFECNHPTFRGSVHEYNNKIKVFIRRNLEKKEYVFFNRNTNNAFKLVERIYLEFLSECN